MRQVGLGVILREQSFYHGTNVIIKNGAIVSKKEQLHSPAHNSPVNPFQHVPWNHSWPSEFKTLILEQETNYQKNCPALVSSGGEWYVNKSWAPLNI